MPRPAQSWALEEASLMPTIVSAAQAVPVSARQPLGDIGATCGSSDPESPIGEVSYIGPETPLIDSLKMLLSMSDSPSKSNLIAQWIQGKGVFEGKQKEAREVIGTTYDQLTEPHNQELEAGEVDPQILATLHAKLRYVKGVMGISGSSSQPGRRVILSRKQRFDISYNVECDWRANAEESGIQMEFVQPDGMRWTACLRTQIPELKLVDFGYFTLDWSSVPIELDEWIFKPAELRGIQRHIQLRLQVVSERGQRFLKQISEDLLEHHEHDAILLDKLVDAIQKLEYALEDRERVPNAYNIPQQILRRITQMKDRILTWMEIFTTAEGGLSAYPLQEFITGSATHPPPFSTDYEAAYFRFMTTYERVFYDPRQPPLNPFPITTSDIHPPETGWPFKPTYFTSPRNLLPPANTCTLQIPPFDLTDPNPTPTCAAILSRLRTTSPQKLNLAESRTIMHGLALHSMLSTWRSQSPKAQPKLFVANTAELAKLTSYGREIWTRTSRCHAIFKAAALVLEHLDVVWGDVVMAERWGALEMEGLEEFRGRMVRSWGGLAAQVCVDFWGAVWGVANEVEVLDEEEEGVEVSSEESCGSSDGEVEAQSDGNKWRAGDGDGEVLQTLAGLQNLVLGGVD